MDLIRIAEQIISGQMELVDFEDETICFVDSSTDFKVIEHYYNGIFYGYNVYAREGQNLKLLETYNNKKKAERVVKHIRKSLSTGATYYKLPSN